MLRVDEEMRSTLKGGGPGKAEDYAARVRRIKREQLREQSHSKHQIVERKLHERYDIDGFERYRVLPANLRPTEWPTPLRHASKERDRSSGNHGLSAGPDRPRTDTLNDREPMTSTGAKNNDDELLEAKPAFERSLHDPKSPASADYGPAVSMGRGLVGRENGAASPLRSPVIGS